ncbi:15754_t:CDS:2 [Cetraspora pellucida]|uniref:15754_t:CDS:1 n=1 Tax=Cetraspora pellucida TaxID=1433469 RepID=A0A9N9CBS1_9GLOM|nr:15754_t:CDS:2 [Cetraspora pellucida]
MSFYLHSDVLKRRSKYFQAALSSEWVRKQENLIVLSLPTISPEVFNFILNHLYTEKLSFEGAPTDGKSCLNRIVAADELGLSLLSLHEQRSLIANRSEWLHDWELLKSRLINIIPLVRFEHISRRDLYKYVKPFSELLPKNVLAIIPTQEYDCILSNNLNTINFDDKENLINFDNNGIIINFDNKENSINFDNKESSINLNNNDLIFNDSKGDMLNFDNKDFMFNDSKGNMLNFDNNLNIFNDIKSNTFNIDNKFNFDIKKNIVNVSNIKRSQQIDSIIISISHLPQISDWIKGKPTDNLLHPIPFNFSLIFRASRDGYSPETFHRWCDDYGAPTLTVIKLKDSCQIIGGYNCFSWKSPLFTTTQHDENAFIFSLCDKDGNRERAKVARPKRIKMNNCDNKKGNLLCNSKMGNLLCNSKKGNFIKATKDHFISPGPSLKFSRFRGPCFGKSDLQLQNRLCYCKQRDYDDNITDQSGLFEIDDFEIFRVEMCQK